MNKIKNAVSVIIVAVCITGHPPIVQAQSPVPTAVDTWEVLRSIPPGDELAIDLKSGKKISGRMGSVSDSAITLKRGNASIDAVRADVGRVRRTVPRSALRETLVGLGIGAGAGVALGAAAASGQLDNGEAGFAMLVFGTLGSGIGALSGFIVGMRKERVLVYESK